MHKSSLINKYNVSGPRYTSYPTVPYWDESNFTSELYLHTLKNTFESSNLQGIENTLELLEEMKSDGLLTIEGQSLVVAKEAIPFIRNVCMAFDKHLTTNQPEKAIFSKTI